MPVVRGVNVEVTGAGPHTVVLLHGFSDNLSTWRRIVPALAVRHRVLAIDLPGHGATTRSWTRPLIPGFFAAIDDVLTAYGIDEPVSMVGNSMGAATTAMYADAFSERVDQVALIGMPGMRGIPLLWRAAVSRPATVAIRAALAPVPQRRLQAGMGWFYAHAATPHPGLIDAAALRGYSAHYGQRWQMHQLSELGRLLMTELLAAELAAVVGRLDVPALQIWGRYDYLVPPRRVHADDRHVVLAGCGHCPQLDVPDRLLDVLLPYLGDSDHRARQGRPMRASGS
jgi:pimeloyl-ACP methyl ester carboxylesterase